MVSYFRQYLKDFRATGSLCSSSRFLVRKMLAPIDFDKAKVIVELGPGSGCFTKKILACMRSDAKLYTVEIQEDFVKQLQKIEDKRLKIIHASAENTDNLVPKADYVVSGLPLVSLPKEVGERIIQAIIKSLKTDGKYVQFQYSLTSYKKFKSLFKNVDVSFTLFNFPPAFVYACKN